MWANNGEIWHSSLGNWSPQNIPNSSLDEGNPRWSPDGQQILFGRDIEGVLKLGNAHETPLEEIWNGEKMRQLRDRHRRLDFPSLCANCSEYETPKVSPRFS